MRKDGSAKFLWFLAGLGFGTAAGILMAPKSGDQTRRMIGNYINTHGHDYYDRGRELYDRGRQLADEAADLFDEGRKLMEEAEAQAEEASRV